jgi:hypothetical protein
MTSIEVFFPVSQNTDATVKRPCLDMDAMRRYLFPHLKSLLSSRTTLSRPISFSKSLIFCSSLAFSAIH